jgi:uncharacterized protein YjbI with pentapeptide repeats
MPGEIAEQGAVMGNAEHLAVLRQGAERWNAWRSGNSSLRPDLAGLDLTAASLGETLLVGADLNRADLNQADLSRTNLSRANLNRANLSGALLGGSELSEADLSGANLSRANLSNAILTGANLSRANLSEAVLNRANLSHATLSLANLTKATGDHINLGQAVLSGALLRETTFGHGDLAAADLSGADIARAYLADAALAAANLRSADLRGANLRGARLNNANLSLADLSQSNLIAADLSGADLTGANLRGADLTLANLSNAELTNVVWQLKQMRGRFLGIRGLDSCYGNALFKRAAADQDFLDTLEEHLKGTRRMALFRIWGVIDYGRSLLRVALLSFGLAGLYGLIYRVFPQILDYKNSAKTWFTPYYFSIVTYTTLGFGDIKPKTLAGELVVSSEVILGYTTLGLLLAVLAQNIARRS